jgi:hypothetical protein
MMQETEVFRVRIQPLTLCGQRNFNKTQKQRYKSTSSFAITHKPTNEPFLDTDINNGCKIYASERIYAVSQ